MALVKTCKKPPMSIIPVSGSICTFNALQTLPLKSLEVDIDYTGSGISSVHIQNTCGINQWDEQWEVGTYDASGQKASDNRMIRSKNYIAIKPSTTYYAQSANVAFVYFFYDANRNYISSNYVTNNTFTSPANAYYMNFRTSADYGNVYHNDISVNSPATNTSYNAFEGTSETISFGTSIYGGTYNARTGILTSTKASDGSDITPVETQIAPCPIETLQGVNNIWADTGNTNLSWIKIGR